MNRAWGTKDELYFIDNLGRFAINSPSREDLLDRYRMAIQKRARWDAMDRKEVMEHLRRAK